MPTSILTDNNRIEKDRQIAGAIRQPLICEREADSSDCVNDRIDTILYI